MTLYLRRGKAKEDGFLPPGSQRRQNVTSLNWDERAASV